MKASLTSVIQEGHVCVHGCWGKFTQVEQRGLARLCLRQWLQTHQFALGGLGIQAALQELIPFQGLFSSGKSFSCEAPTLNSRAWVPIEECKEWKSSVHQLWSTHNKASQSTGPEGPMNQADKAKRFLLPLPTRLKVAGRQDNYSLACQPWRPQARSQRGAVDDPEGSLTAHRAVIEQKGQELLVQLDGQKLELEPEAHGGIPEGSSDLWLRDFLRQRMDKGLRAEFGFHGMELFFYLLCEREAMPVLDGGKGVITYDKKSILRDNYQ
ncbi:hypothetical protein EK904_012141 [Melospiza melodia maxima]|nr:hypothetical protein EK904_012141 [Melospiza melodia maxima]